MSNVRRWYTYLVCAISLQSITWAVIFLLRNLLWFKSRAPAASTAFQIAVIIVGLPLFLVHWLWAQRLSNKDPDERAAFLRRLYLYGMLAGFLIPFIANAFGFASNVLWKVFQGTGMRSAPFLEGRTLNEAILDGLVAMVVLALLWAYHYRIVTLDAKVAPEKGISATVRRLYVFGFSGVGVTLTTLAIIHLLRSIMHPTFNP